MKILEHIGIQNDQLQLSENCQNHVSTVHAGALFILAENASGNYLVQLFPELKDQVVPLLRDSYIKYKKSAVGTITAYPSLSIEAQEQFQKQFTKKSRGTIEVSVILKDEKNDIVTLSKFTWFIQKI